MKSNKLKTTNYLVPEGTTHLMIWLFSEIPEEREVKTDKILTYQALKTQTKKYVNYVKTLQEECKKMAKRNEACIFVYDSAVITKEQEAQIHDVVKKIPNCYVVDYRKFILKLNEQEDIEYYYDFTKEKPDNKIKKIKQSFFIQYIENLIEKQKECIFDSKFMGDIVDCVRMLLLLHPHKLKEIAMSDEINKDKEIKLDTADFCLLYHDFDIIQKEEDERLNKQYNQHESLKDYPLSVCTCMNHPSSIMAFENGLIFSNSISDRNKALEHTMTDCCFINKNFTMYYAILKNVKNGILNINDFTKQFIDERHKSWTIPYNQKKEINNKKNSNFIDSSNTQKQNNFQNNNNIFNFSHDKEIKKEFKDMKKQSQNKTISNNNSSINDNKIIINNNLDIKSNESNNIYRNGSKQINNNKVNNNSQNSSNNIQK